MKKKTNYTAEFKAKVVMESIKGSKGNAELCSDYKIPVTTFQQWKDKALENFYQIFIPESEHTKRQKLFEQQVESLHKIIGEITIENNFLKKKLQK